MSNVSIYTNYFENLAVQHKDIRHTTATTPDVDVETKHFCRWNAEEAIAGLRTKISFNKAALLIELYDTDLAAANVYDIKQRPKGAFTVLCYALLNDYKDEARAFDDAERIVYDILKQIWQDHYAPGVERCNTTFRQVYFDKMVITPISALFGSNFGFRVEFDFEFQQALKITQAPAEGTFITS